MNLLEYRINNESAGESYSRRYSAPSHKGLALYNALSQDYVSYEEPKKYS